MEIRPTQIDELPVLAEFLTHQGMPRSPDVLRWKFWASSGEPVGHSKSFLAEMDGRIVGHIGIVPTTVRAATSPVGDFDGGWFVDWMVRDDLRSRGIGIFLLRKAAAMCRALMTIQGSAETRTVLGQLKWSGNRRLAIYKLNVRSGAMGCSAGGCRRMAAELARVLRYHPVTHRPPDGWQLIEPSPDGTDAWWDRLDAALERRSPSPNGSFCHFGRSGAFLRWSFRDHPTHRYHLSIVCDGEEPVGYAVRRTLLRPDGRREGRIVDAALPWDRHDAWRWLVSTVTARLAAEGVMQVSCLAGTGAPLADALLANRYLLRGPVPLWMSPQATALTDQTRWHATFADSDIDTAAEP